MSTAYQQLTIQRVVTYSHRKQGTFLDEEHVFHQVIAGRWEFRMAGRRYVAGPGDLVLLPPYLLHTVKPIGRTQVILQVCHFIAHDRFSELDGAPMVVSLPKKQQGGMAKIFRTLSKEWIGSSPHRTLMMSALLLQILSNYLRCTGTEVPFESTHYRAWSNIHDAIIFLQENHHKSNLGIDENAAASHLSPAHFSRQFKTLIGMSPYRYLRRYRIDRAKVLLMNGRLSCTEVGLATGHVNVALFSRVFRQFEGMSPTRWMDTTIFSGAARP
jgi:AraC-like DNA-binding protein